MASVQAAKRKLATVSLLNKYKALKEIDSGQTCVATAKKYGVAKNTISHWVKKKKEIFEAVEQNNVSKRRKDMFAVPNRKAMEVVVYFLFTKLNHESTRETFRNCWPIVDKKKEQEFRKLTAEWLIRIKKDDPDSHLPNIVPSLLLSPTGDKFYQYLFYFSTYVLKQKMSSLPHKHGNIPIWPSIMNANRKYLPQLQRSLAISTLKQQHRLITDLEEATLTKENWMEFSKELSKEHRKLSKQKRDCVKQSKDLKEKMEKLLGKR